MKELYMKIHYPEYDERQYLIDDSIALEEDYEKYQILLQDEETHVHNTKIEIGNGEISQEEHSHCGQDAKIESGLQSHIHTREL